MLINTTYRTNEAEIMDDFQMEGASLEEALDKIARINQLLGGNQLTLQGIKSLIKNIDASRELTIVDVGCGNGDMLRYIAQFGKSNSFKFKLIGIDANAFTIKHAQNLSSNFDSISYKCEDIFNDDFQNLKYDILLCTLTLHHFKDEEILNLMKVFYSNSKIGIVINDLHRSKVAYRLFQLICMIFGLNRMSKYDGLISILRGFKKEEIQSFSKQLGFKKYTLQWKWAFRYQWIIAK